VIQIRELLPMAVRYRLMDLRGRGVYAGYPNDYKCIFIHIPKTAGTSIVKSLFNCVSRHTPYFEYQKANKQKFDDYFKFCFVRNPWDRLLSTYLFLKKGGLNAQDEKWAKNNISQYETFNEFVTSWVNETNIMQWIHFYPQHYFVCDGDLNIMVDYVGRQERIDEGYDFVCKKLGMENNLLSKVNTTQHKHYSFYYSEEAKQIVEKVYHKDIELFGYEFSRLEA